jgi:hypothetical protein
MAKQERQVMQFKITLKGIEPAIWRRIQIVGTATFWDLHVAIQDAMGWQDYHLHSFFVQNPDSGNPVTLGIPTEDDEFNTLPDWEHGIADFFCKPKDRALYVYDFGDDWQHMVELEKIEKAVKRKRYPICLDGARRCPPEDVGGIGGFMNFLEIINDPDHPEHAEMLDWIGGRFNAEGFSPKLVLFDAPQERLEALLQHH